MPKNQINSATTTHEFMTNGKKCLPFWRLPDYIPMITILPDGRQQCKCGSILSAKLNKRIHASSIKHQLAVGTMATPWVNHRKNV